MFFPDLTCAAARDWVLGEICRVVETYEVKWIKLDCNHDFAPDPNGEAHRGRIESWFAILDEIARRFPDLVLEGCASGGMRSDILMASQFHTHFLSDTVDPIDTIRIGMSTLGRLPPRLTGKWAVIYPTGGGFTLYERPAGDTGDLVLCPAIATSRVVSSVSAGLRHAVGDDRRAGTVGQLAGLPRALRREVAGHLEFYKRHRKFIQNSIGIPLTRRGAPGEARRRWRRFNSAASDFRSNLCFVYNLGSAGAASTRASRGLGAAGRYAVRDEQGRLLVQLGRRSRPHARWRRTGTTARVCTRE